MASPARPTPALSVEDYLDFEEASPVRHEYVDGHVYAMSGGTARHNRIALSITARLLAAAGEGPCQVFASDMKVRADETTFYYPDVVVTCAPLADDAVVVRDPCLVVEVTSPKTATVDRREKLKAYRKIKSLRTYLIVDHRRRYVERHWRDEEGQWWEAMVTPEATAGRIPVPCPAGPDGALVLTLDQIYGGTELA